jgi:hypothetical protein
MAFAAQILLSMTASADEQHHPTVSKYGHKEMPPRLAHVIAECKLLL